MSLSNDLLYDLARNYSNGVYNSNTDPLSVSRIHQAIIAASLQGQFTVVFEYPKTVSQALIIDQQGNTPDFDPDVLEYYKTAVQAIDTAFTGSKFVLNGLPDAGGFKVSWSTAKPSEVEIAAARAAAEAEASSEAPVVEVEATKDNVE